MINLTTFFTSLGIVSGNTQAKSFYDFWYGIEFGDGTITYNITDFMTYLGTTRYEFFHSLESTYPSVYDEYTFYKNIDDNRIYDFSTFYTYAGEYLGGGVISYQFYLDDNYWALAECSYTSQPIIIYTNTNNPQPGDIIYTDSNLTTTYEGKGIGNYARWGIVNLDYIVSGNWEIDTDGTILTNQPC